jgi:NAD(P)-dependent dehydrogenase (short-subunit alcohol dehydrogenase family)
LKTIVVSGGTSGIGRALAETYLARGDQVVIIGLDPEKGHGFLEEADRIGSGQKAFFIQADLGLIEENLRVVDEIATQFPVVDALALCARYFRSYRRVTSEGIEHNFALYYLSRYLLGYGLVDQLEKSESPVIMNIAGPGVTPGAMQWDDLQMEHGYDGWSAMFQGGKLNDLLGVSFAAQHRGHRTRYVLVFPGNTRTSFAGEFDAPTAMQAEHMRRTGQPVEAAVAPIIEILDNPPQEPLSAYVEGRALSIKHPSFDTGHAARLDSLTHEFLQRREIGLK